MSKPIFIIRFPYLQDMDKTKFERYYKEIVEQLVDYHVLSLIESRIEKVEFECFNSPHTEIEFEELKKQVLEMIK